MKAFKQFISNNKEITNLQDNFIAWVTANFKSGTIWIDGIKLDNVVLKTGTNKVEHKLGRKLQGVEFTWVPGLVSVYPTARDEKYITIQSSANITIDMWVF